MKSKWNINLLPWLILGLGGFAAALQRLMLSLFLDEKGLLIPWNLPQLLTGVLTIAVTALVLLPVRKLEGSNRYGDNFSPSLAGGITAFLAAIGILLLLAGNLEKVYDNLGKVWLAVGVLAVPCLLFTGFCRIQGRRPAFPFHGLLCIFFAVHLAHHYRLWSGDPQTANYLWQLLGSVGLTLTAYYRAAFDVGLGRRRMQIAVGLLTGYCCLAASTGADGIYYLLSGLWALCNLCSLTPKPRRQRPSPEEVPQEP